ncbi:MAG TPA: GNAT family N-acetyltransferase [Verrucomicrobiae bacterium]|nr:GNAT family N-acetyltransferase [Verrucomicrobiae bacterium]
MAEFFDIRGVKWPEDSEKIRYVRAAVFVREQRVPEKIEIDGRDPDCFHLLAVDAHNNPVGTARMDISGHLGRIAVLRSWRNRGIGSGLVREMIRRSGALGLKTVDLNAQVHALGFYERLGFKARGEIFYEANIPHRNMILNVTTSA